MHERRAMPVAGQLVISRALQASNDDFLPVAFWAADACATGNKISAANTKTDVLSMVAPIITD
jgi:hypothetical protein